MSQLGPYQQLDAVEDTEHTVQHGRLFCESDTLHVLLGVARKSASIPMGHFAFETSFGVYGSALMNDAVVSSTVWQWLSLRRE